MNSIQCSQTHTHTHTHKKGRVAQNFYSLHIFLLIEVYSSASITALQPTQKKEKAPFMPLSRAEHTARTIVSLRSQRTPGGSGPVSRRRRCRNQNQNQNIHCPSTSLQLNILSGVYYPKILVLRVPQTDYIYPHPASLHWLPIESQIPYKLASFCYSCLCSTASACSKFRNQRASYAHPLIFPSFV